LRACARSLSSCERLRSDFSGSVQRAQGPVLADHGVDLARREVREDRLAERRGGARQPRAHLPDEADRQRPLPVRQDEHVVLVEDREVPISKARMPTW
jgi:hypothetical protein